MAINILVVDDSIVTRMMIARTLRLAKIPIASLYEAENGRIGLSQMLINSIDIVIADLNMPVMTGFEMIDQMNKDEQLKNIPIIVVSTEGSVTRIEKLEKMGVSAYIKKPFTPEGIRDAISNVLGGFENETD